VKCVQTPDNPFWTLRSVSPKLPRVSIIVGPGQSETSLGNAAGFLQASTDYPDCEFIVATGVEDQPSSQWFASPFAEASGKVFCFVSSSLQPLSDEWLRELVGHALRSDVGAVAARLLDHNRYIAHAGYRLNSEDVVRPLYAGAPSFHTGYMDGARLVQTLAAVGGGCLVVSRKKFLDAGGFNHPDLSGTLAEVDLCLRLSSLGLRNLWTPNATLCAQKGTHLPPPSEKQFSEVRRLWGHRLAADPCANINLGLEGNFPCLHHGKARASTRKPTSAL
jgi:GT2 family glycosyltransferase